MLKPLTIAAVVAAFTLSAGCASRPINGSVMPMGNGQYQGITKARDESTALKMAQLDAETTCKEREKKKKYVVDHYTSEYVGPKIDNAGGGLTGLAGAALQFAGQKNNKENYKVEMAFSCS